jgi:hypothetical protein
MNDFCLIMNTFTINDCRSNRWEITAHIHCWPQMNNIKYVKLISNIKFATIRYKDSTLGTKNIRFTWITFHTFHNLLRITNNAIYELVSSVFVCVWDKRFKILYKSNTTGAICGAGTAYPSGVPEFASRFLLQLTCLHIFSVVLWNPNDFCV